MLPSSNMAEYNTYLKHLDSADDAGVGEKQKNAVGVDVFLK